MHSILSAERASIHCVRIWQRSICPISSSLGSGQRPVQRARIFSCTSYTRQRTPSPLPSHGQRRRIFSSMPEQSAQVSAQEAIKAVESQCPKEAESGKAETSSSTESKSEPALPPLSGHEFKQYNRLAEHMNHFVSSFLFILILPHLPKNVSNSRSSTKISARHGTYCTPQPHLVADRPG